MNYSILCHETAANFAARSAPDPAKRSAFWAAIGDYLKALKQAGVYVGGAGLELPETTSTLRFCDGQYMVQDGRYAETKEQLGGIFVIDVPDRVTAMEWAARCPPLPDWCIGVRANLLQLA